MVYQNINIIYRICNLYASDEDREDLKQEIIYQLWRSYPDFRGDSRFQTWMYRVAINTAMLGLRARKVKYTMLSSRDLEMIEEPGNDDSEETKILQLYAHISKLNDLDKTIIFLYLERCSYDEIAGITGITAGNVSVRLVRIREKLRKRFHIQNTEG